MKRLILSVLLILALATPSHALFWRQFSSLGTAVGGMLSTTGQADCSALGTGSDDGSAIVQLENGAVYFYYFDRSATDATSSPDYIRCVNYSSSGVWLLKWSKDENGVMNPTDTPSVTGHHDTDDEDVFQIKMANKAATEADTQYYGFTGNGLSLWGTHDGGDDDFNFAVPITAPAVDNGTNFYATTATTINLATSYSTVCEYVFGNGDSAGNSTWTLPISPLCNDDALYMKKFTFVNNDPNHLLIIAPGSGDSIQVRGSQYEVCDADVGLFVEVSGVVLLYGRTASLWWAIPLGGTNVLCGSDPSP